MPTVSQSRAWRIYGVMLALNFAAAIAYGWFAYTLRNLDSLAEHEAGYWFFRAALRLSDAVGFGLPHPLEVTVSGRPGTVRAELFFGELVILLSSAAIATLGMAAILRTHYARKKPVWPAAGVAGLFAPPLCYFAVFATTRAFSGTGIVEAVEPLGRHILLRVLIGEILCLLVLLLASRRWRLSVLSFGILLALHYGLWTLALAGLLPSEGHRLYSPLLLLPIFPLFGVAWLSTLRREPPTDSKEMGHRRRSIAALVALAVLLFLWSPRPARSFRSVNREGLVIQLQRTSCLGSCPIYRLAIFGDGSVSYSGDMFVKVKGAATTKITPAEVDRLLQSIDEVGFAGIDDRAFPWCYDAPAVSVTVSSPTLSKKITADAACFGPRGSLQHRVLLLAEEIDKTVGSEQWVRTR
jgi:hypothetical protein